MVGDCMNLPAQVGCPAGANALWRCRSGQRLPPCATMKRRIGAGDPHLPWPDTRYLSFVRANAADVHDVRNCQRYADVSGKGHSTGK